MLSAPTSILYNIHLQFRYIQKLYYNNSVKRYTGSNVGTTSIKYYIFNSDILYHI